MNSIFASLATLSLIAAAPADAASGDKSESAETQAEETPKAERKICKNFENTASRMKRTRLCLTKADWKKFDRAN